VGARGQVSPGGSQAAGSVFATMATSRSASKSTRSGSRGSSAAKKSRRSSRDVIGSVLAEHRADLWGLGSIVLGLLAAGSVWISIAGPVGEAIDDTLALAIGLMRVVIPVALIGLGVLLVRGEEREDGADRVDRMLLGSALLLIAITGLFHVVRGRPGIDSPVSDLGAAGGVLGMSAGGPLHAVAEVWGAVLVLGFLGLLGAIVLTRSSAGAVGRLLARSLRPVTGAVKRGSDTLFSEPDGAASGSVIDLRGTTLYDQDTADGHADAEPEASVDLEREPEFERRPVRSAGAVKEAEQQSLRLPGDANNGKWKLPPTRYLSRSTSREVDKNEVKARGHLLQATLDQFGVPTTPLEPIVGPTVTRFVLELGEGVKVSKLESLRKDIAYAMASPDVRILAPIPGRRAIGVEVPNLDRQIVALGDILSSKEARDAGHPLQVAVGRDINGRAMMMNLATMPHLLIAGATGAGKSSCLNSLITSILMRSTPDQVRMILVDPKRVEMGQYDKVPHLLTAPVTDPRKAANALAWAVREMERRYDLLHKVGFRDITGYNAAVDRGDLEAGLGEVDDRGEPLVYRRLPYVLVVVDELADLMMVAARDVEDSIARIAQMARAVGIHLVIATQRPSVNIITGVIKANIPARLAFMVSSLTDSRVILDQQGAERLVGSGDMLLLGPSSSAPHRIQGCWVEESEVRAVVKHWRDQAPRFRDDRSVSSETIDGAAETAPEINLGGAPAIEGSITDAPPPAEEDDGDELFEQAMELVVETQLGSTSMLQRKLRVGFARAGRIMDILEQRGVVGPSTGSKAREVLMTPEELAERRARS
jgi:S-DNA-T family DNA segregation ATPase FtsK/SpoIIIE